MYKIKEAIIVEGKYDKIRLSGFIDGIIITTNGFTVYKDKKNLKTIESLAKTSGIVILTDSDSAGFRIRSFIRQYITDGIVKNAYIPEIFGKEKRKNQASKEGLLGVEGISNDIILKALTDAGCEIDGKSISENNDKITKTDLYLAGFSGGENSVYLRGELLKRLNMPSKISANMLINVLNMLMSKEQFINMADEILSMKGNGQNEN